jgi:hypothetical protein
MDEYTNDEKFECDKCENSNSVPHDVDNGLCKKCYYKNKEEEIDYYYYKDKEEDEEVMDKFFLHGFKIIQKEADKYLEDRLIREEARKQESDNDSDYESDDGDDLSGDPKLPRKEAERIIKCHINYNFRQQDVEKFFEVINDKTLLEEEVFEFAENWNIQEDRNKQLRKCKTDTLYKQKLMKYAWSDYLLVKLIEECYFDISYF